mmetsp:Transcript_29387/g.59170  ORF Transcript_29387/g.59170 Transcript_29387/m.59170 type:complete len:117 (-) Transcript_29387:405-755(-)
MASPEPHLSSSGYDHQEPPALRRHHSYMYTSYIYTSYVCLMCTHARELVSCTSLCKARRVIFAIQPHLLSTSAPMTPNAWHVVISAYPEVRLMVRLQKLRACDVCSDWAKADAPCS